MRIGRNLIQPFPKFSTYEGPCNCAIKRTSELLIFREKTSRIKTKWKQYLQKLTSRFYATVDKCELRELLFELMGKDFMQAKLN